MSYRIEIDYVEDSQINLDQLEVEWVQHPEKEEAYIAQVSDKKLDWVHAIEAEKAAHEKLKTKRSKLIQFCHNNPEKCVGKKSATGPEAEAYYRTHPDYLAAKKKHNQRIIMALEAEAEWEAAKDMKDLMHFTKTKALEQLVLLHGQGYFAGPETPRQINMNDFMRKSAEKNRSAEIGQNLRVRRN